MPVKGLLAEQDVTIPVFICHRYETIIVQFS